MKQRLEGAAADLKLPAWPVGATAAAPRAALLQAHLFGKAVRLLANIAAFDALLGRGTLLSLALERLLQLQVRTREITVSIPVTNLPMDLSLTLYHNSSLCRACYKQKCLTFMMYGPLD